jgi:hypothetical protein
MVFAYNYGMENKIQNNSRMTLDNDDTTLYNTNMKNNTKGDEMKTTIHYNSTLKTVNVHNVICVVVKSTNKVIGTISKNGSFHQDPLVVRTMQIEYDNA